MDIGRAVYVLAETYVVILGILSIVTVAWALDLFEGTDARIAGIWFGVAGFGFLVFVTFILIHLTRD